MNDADWLKLLQAGPEDAELKLAYATWLQDEADRPLEAEAWRWLVREGKRPQRSSGWDPEFWFWYTADDMETGPVAVELLNGLGGFDNAGGAAEAGFLWRGYHGRQAAERALVAAYAKARQEGWSP